MAKLTYSQISKYKIDYKKYAELTAETSSSFIRIDNGLIRDMVNEILNFDFHGLDENASPKSCVTNVIFLLKWNTLIDLKILVKNS